MKLQKLFSATIIGLGGALVLGSASLAPDARADNKQAGSGCSNATLKGSFGFYRTGSTPDGPLAALGIIHYDGQQNFSGSQSISRNGEYDFDIPLAGGYAVAADCTGIGFSPAGVEFFRLVVIDGGKGLYIFSESNGNAVYGVGRKIASSDEN